MTIGDHVFIGPNVGIYTVTHALLPDQRNAGVMRSLPITIGDNVVIGAGSVVTKDIPPNVVAVGNPCRILREIGEYDREYYFKNRKFPPVDRP